MLIPLRAGFDADQLRSLARNTKDAAQARRLLAFAGRGGASDRRLT
jgi:hypothetical protein